MTPLLDHPFPTLAELYDSLSAREAERRLLEDNLSVLLNKNLPELQSRTEGILRINKLLTEVHREIANAISRPSVRRLGILNLPEELLIQIFKCVENRQPSPCDPHGWLRNTQGLRNVRLVCWRFSSASASLLVPSVNVNFDRPSLSRLDQIASHPSVRLGVKRVILRCEFYIQEAAENHDLFEIWAQQSLLKAAQGGDPSFEIEGGHRDRDEDDIGDAEKVAIRYNSLFEQLRPRDYSSFPPNPYWDHHHRVLSEAQDDYRGLYAAQCHLLQSGDFARTLAAILAKLPGGRELHIIERRPECPERWGLGATPMRELINDDSWLRKNLSLPLSHYHIGPIINEMERRRQAGQFNAWERTMTPPCSFFDYVSDILCKLGEYNVAIAQLVMEGGVPPQPTDLVLESEYQFKVTSAVSSLRLLVLNISFGPHTIAMLPCRQRSAFASILCLLASGPRLQNLGLNLDRQLKRRFCMLVARPRQSLRSVRSLHLDIAPFRLQELRVFMDRLGPDIKRLTLAYMSPSIEEYIDGLDVMRLWREAAAPKCVFRIIPLSFWATEDSERETHHCNELDIRSTSYINGDTEQYPRMCSCMECLEEWEGTAKAWFDSKDEE